MYCHFLGNSLKAAQILEDLEKLCPGVLVIMSRRINIIRRRGEYDKVCTYYEQYLAENAEKKEICSSLSIKYARFCCKVRHDCFLEIGIEFSLYLLECFFFFIDYERRRQRHWGVESGDWKK